MLISYNWLRELTGTKLTPLELRERLTMVGLAIDSVNENEGDALLDVEVPSNRPDCLSHVGIAREVAVIEKSNLLNLRSEISDLKSKVAKTEGKAGDFAAVEIEDTDLCPRYAARIVRGVKIGPSPDWLAKRLNEIGQRPINNVADITNYVLHELGQPLHAFDLARLNGQKIIVRRARAGEKLQTLDGVDRILDNEMLVIADAERPVALAGIMGGLDSEISTSTVDVLIESAYFDPDSIRRTARKLGMDTEASKRFERGADCENVVNAQTRCVELICEIAGGTATEDVIDVYPRPLAPRSITFRPERVESLTSLRVDVAEMDRILVALGFVEGAAAKNTKIFVVPSWRVDVSLEEDLVEEIARHVGYEHIGSELPPSAMAGEYQPAELKRRKIRRALTSLGFDEAINLSFIDPAHDEVFALAATNQLATQSPFVTLSNPILEDATRMRPSLLPGLLQALRHNLNQGTKDVRLFEIGRVFAGSDGADLPHESESLALILSGGASEQDRAQASRELDFYDLTGALQAAIVALNLPPLVFAEAEVKHLRAGQSANISLADGPVIGSAGTLSETISAGYKFRQRVYVAELSLTAVFEISEHEIKYTPLPRYPAVVRDVTLLVGRNIGFSELVGAIESEEIDDYQRVKLVGTYEGENIPADKRSVTLRVEYRSDQRTLRDEEVEERHRRLLDSLLKKFSAVLH
jgi:phenylalanyl-tRNA synthetase beta chain